MKIILSPTKKQRLGNTPIKYSSPYYINKSLHIMNILKNLNKEDLMSIFSISEKLAEENIKRNQVWTAKPSTFIGSNAIFTYSGEAFSTLNPHLFSKDDLEYANDNLLILSGLYGVLKPLDIIMPYRLDIKDKINIPDFKTLYDFWTNDITNYLIDNSSNSKYLLNLSSLEYSKSINFQKIDMKIITPEFKTKTAGELKTVAMWSKKMRGFMAQQVILNKIKTEEELQKLELPGYKLEDIINGRYLYIKHGE